MSIVEKALKKLQSAGGSTPPPTGPAASRMAAGDLALNAASAAIAEPRRRPRVGSPTRTVTIDVDKLRREGLLPPEHQQRELSHQYRTLKRPLIRNAFEEQTASDSTVRGPHSVMVSSALPGEGKTFTSINLALSLALERDHSVLLVDGDIPKPHVSTTLGLRNDPGLLDLLTDPTLPVESVVLPTDVRGLSVLPVGRNGGESATELLASARMREIISQLEQLDPQGIVLVDSPPILLTSEARVLASLFGQVVIVVKAGVTPQQAVTEAIGIIGEGPRLGLVLNEATHVGAAGGYYGYYYGGAAGSADNM